MLCTKCGENIPADYSLCPRCGFQAGRERQPPPRRTSTNHSDVSGKSAVWRYSLLLLVAVLVVVNLTIGYHYIKEKLGPDREPSGSVPAGTPETTLLQGTTADPLASGLPASEEKGEVDARVHVIEREAHRWDRIEADLPREKVDGKPAPQPPLQTQVSSLPVPVTPVQPPQNPTTPSAPSPAAMARQYELHGIAEFNKGNYAVALERFEHALQKTPKNRNLKREIALTYNKIGWANVKKGEYWDAIGNFKEAISHNQDEASFYLGLGLSYFQMKNYEGAIVELGTAAKMTKNDPMPHQLLGQIYYQRDELDRTLEHWEKALEIDPSDTRTRSKIAKIKREKAVQGDFNRDTSSHFTIRYEGGERAETGRKVLQILEDAYSRLGRELSYYPPEDIVVILYSNQQFRDITQSPGWAGGAFDGKVRIPVGNVSEDDPRLARVVRHEYTHALLHSMTPNVPTWLNEGLARYFEHGNEGAIERKALRGIAKKDMLIPLASLEGGFSAMSRERAWLAYAESLSAVTYLVERYGIYDTKRLLIELEKGNSIHDALQDVLFISYEDFQDNWKKYLDE